MNVYFAAIVLWQEAAASPALGDERWFFTSVWFWVALIFLVFAVGVVLLLRFQVFLKKESRVLQTVRERLDNLYAQETPWNEDAAEMLLDGVDENSVFAKIVGFAQKMRKRKAALDPQMAREMVEAEVQRGLTGARFVAGSLILFGLMGTLVGLSSTVTQLAAAARQVEENLGGATAPHVGRAKYSSEQAVRNLLGPWQSGMNSAATAFFASLSGVSGTVIFLLLLSRTNRRAMQFGSRFRAFFLTDLGPFMALPEAQQSFDRIADELGKSGKVLRTLGENMAVQADAVERDMHMAEIILRNCDEREARFLEELQETASAQRESAGRLISLAETTRNLQESSTQALGLLRSALEQFEKAVASTDVKLGIILRRAEDGYMAARTFYQSEPGFSWSALAHSSKEQIEQLRIAVEELEGIRDESSQTQQAFRATREVLLQQLEQRDLSNAALSRLPEAEFWQELMEKLSALPAAAAKIEDSLQSLSGLSSVLQKMAGTERQEETDERRRSQNGDLAAFQGAVVEAIERSLGGYQVKSSSGGNTVTPQTGVSLDAESIRHGLDEQLRLQNELLSYNRKIYRILSQTHVLKSATQRFFDFWRGRREN
jgi:hypothetical protein